MTTWKMKMAMFTCSHHHRSRQHLHLCLHPLTAQPLVEYSSVLMSLEQSRMLRPLLQFPQLAPVSAPATEPVPMPMPVPAATMVEVEPAQGPIVVQEPEFDYVE